MTAKKRIRVFVVDDERIIALTLATILNKSGFIATAFFGPLEALTAARSSVPDLLISDVVMPELSGIDLAIKLRSICPGCKVLLFSGQAATADLLTSAREQGHDFTLLSKPIHPTDLLAAIEDT
jgi:DNA-binding NtrC family response regulator